jgi:hypothetical protein
VRWTGSAEGEIDLDAEEYDGAPAAPAGEPAGDGPAPDDSDSTDDTDDTDEVTA